MNYIRTSSGGMIAIMPKTKTPVAKEKVKTVGKTNKKPRAKAK